jgi:hypothetical protein
MPNPMDKPAQQNPQNPQNPQQTQQQNPQRNPGQGQGQKPRDPSQHDPSQRDPNQQGNPQDRYASGTDRARDVPVDRKGGQAKPGGSPDDRGGKRDH